MYIYYLYLDMTITVCLHVDTILRRDHSGLRAPQQPIDDSPEAPAMSWGATSPHDFGHLHLLWETMVSEYVN